MEKNKLAQIGHALANRLQATDYQRLPISDYNKQYIDHLKPVMGYYMKIYARCLQEGLKLSGLKPEEVTCVDYGGGSGFFSMFAKEAGIGKVIYVDLNPLSVKAVTVLAQEVGIGPDVILEGNSDTLAAWCIEQRVKPQLLIATDLIEHVYNLVPFFADLTSIHPEMHLLFTTASNPYNPFLTRRLHQIMDECEYGKRVLLNYYTARLQFIQKQYPRLTEQQAADWSRQTRGLVYADIQTAINANLPPLLPDKHNTCDPASGNWAERILPIHYYRQLADSFHYSLQIGKGYYNTERTSTLSRLACKGINLLISITGKIGFIWAPYILLTFSPKHSNSEL